MTSQCKEMKQIRSNCKMLSTDLIVVTILTWTFIEATTIYKEVLINTTTNISCIPNEDIQIQWHHTAPNGSINYVYAGGSFYASPTRGFRLEKDSNTGPYYLVIPHARGEDAGLYDCKEDDGSRVFGSTQLTVLESSPVCKSDMRPDGYVGPNTCKLKQETMTFTCTVSFKGKPPQMTWKILNDNHPFNESMCKIESGRINCSLTIRAESKYDGSTFSCQSTKSAAECKTETINVQYFERQFVVGKSPVVAKNIGDKVNCSVKSNQFIEYKWTRREGDKYVTAIKNQELLIQRNGFYRCEVEYSIRNAVCKAFESEVSTPDINNCLPLEGIAVICVLSIIIIIAIVIFVVRRCRKKRCGREGNGKNGGKDSSASMQLQSLTNNAANTSSRRSFNS